MTAVKRHYVSIERTALKQVTCHTGISNTQVLSIFLDGPNTRAILVNIICGYLIIVAHVFLLCLAGGTRQTVCAHLNKCAAQ